MCACVYVYLASLEDPVDKCLYEQILVRMCACVHARVGVCVCACVYIHTGTRTTRSGMCV